MRRIVGSRSLTMLKVDQLMDIRELKQEGHSIRSICRQTGYSRNTVRKVLRGDHDGTLTQRSRGSKLDEYKDYVKKRYEEHGLSAVRLHDEISKMGFAGSVDTVRRHVREPEGKRSARSA